MTQPDGGAPASVNPIGEDAARGVAAYAAAVASDQPAPGGGSVVGVAGALAAALGAMVCRFTPPATPADGTESTLQPLLDELDQTRLSMLDLAEADATAYAAYRTAAALPKGTDQERRERRAAMHAALLEAIEVPLAVARGGARLRSLLAAAAERGNPHLRSDALIGGYLADAALRGALVNVRGNARLLKDDAVARRYLDEADAFDRALATDPPELAVG